MKKIGIYLFASLLTLAWNVSGQENGRKVSSFNEGWKFHLGDVAAASQPSFDDSDWRNLTLPHDWAIEGSFSIDNPSGAGGGALPGGVGWYRKTFRVDPSAKGKKLLVGFDGVYMNSDVWINGHHLGFRPYGYISFQYDLTPHLRFDGENVIAVRVDNSKQPNSRWYSGCGIYRNVWLTETAPVHVDNWGTYVTTPNVSADKATVNIVTTIRNEKSSPANILLKTSIIDQSGKILATAQSPKTIKESDIAKEEQQLVLDNPRRWSIEDPYLYKICTEIVEKGKTIDTYTTPLGVRTFVFDPDKGFSLNGQPVKIKGVCMHHDLGCLGAAVNKRAIERQLQILKGMGVNGIRTSHNPPAPELLQLCDSMGFIVMDETFDMWRKKKTTYDYAQYFNEWHERDLTDHILRDRNHPSVFMWSIGNEVMEQWTDANADTLDIQQANLILNLKRDPASLRSDSMSVNALLTKKLADIVRNLDPTRPITSGNNEPSPQNHLFKSGAIDLIGFNYHLSDFDNGSPISMESFKAPQRKAFYGKCLVVIQSDKTADKIRLTATSNGLKSGSTITGFKR